MKEGREWEIVSWFACQIFHQLMWYDKNIVFFFLEEFFVKLKFDKFLVFKFLLTCGFGFWKIHIGFVVKDSKKSVKESWKREIGN